jgi:methylated-DNA-[protein]-cysteine S-methyltransferase
MTPDYLEMATPVGTLTLFALDDRLCRITIRATEPGTAEPAQPVADSTGESGPVLLCAAAQVAKYFAGHRRAFRLPCDLAGLSPFTRKVLETLQAVPCGTTVTYGELAAQAGYPGAARAVGRAMAANPLPLVIPCHRVVAADGRLGGYSGGAGPPTKAWLLAFEQSNCQSP